jgi:hypothetical protein
MADMDTDVCWLATKALCQHLHVRLGGLIEIGSLSANLSYHPLGLRITYDVGWSN